MIGVRAAFEHPPDLPQEISGKQGLVRKPSHPASAACSGAPASAWPVTAMTGMFFVRASAFSARVACQPSTPGSDRSMTTRSGGRSKARSRASAPLAASTTSRPWNFRYAEYISRLSA